MGTTLSALAICGRYGVTAQVGDSRLYVFRGGHLTQLTKDQSLVGKLIEDGINGFLIASGDVTALADRIAQLAADPDLRTRIADEARGRIVERYSTRAMVARTRAVYEEVQTP